MRRVGIFALIVISLSFSITARAATCNVPIPYATIPLAVADLACDEIVLAAGTFAGATVDRDLTIRGQSRAASIIDSTVIIDAPTILDTVVVSLRTLTVDTEIPDLHGILLDSKFVELDGEDIEISGNALDGISHGPMATDSVVRLRNCDIQNNHRGILAEKIDMDNCNVILNAPGGGIAVGLGGTITNSNISENQNTIGVNDGGGIVFDFPPGGTTLTIEDSTISSNLVNNGGPSNNTADGGGIMVRSGFLFLRRSHVLGNVAGRFGGGVAMGLLSGVAEIDDSTISGNVAYGAGGGIAVRDRFEITGTLIENNRAWFNDSINENGLAAGGGIYVAEDRLDLTDSTVRQNRAEAEISGISINSGGGLYINTTLPVTIENSTIDGNYAEVDGGGLYVNFTTTMTNTTISGNSANRDGGGIFSQTIPSLTHATIVENTADDDADNVGDGGGIFGNANVSYSLIGRNTDNSAGATNHPDCSGGVISTGYSLLRIGDGCAVFNGGTGNQVGSLLTPLDLMLDLPLSHNGGPTETVALDRLSPALDAGASGCETTTPTDQRGLSRLAQDGNRDGGIDLDPCDIGAFEAFSVCAPGPGALFLTAETYIDNRSILSETSITTIGSVVVEDTAKIIFEAPSGMAFGDGFKVLSGAKFSALSGPVDCG